jgi:hypothetical protein
MVLKLNKLLCLIYSLVYNSKSIDDDLDILWLECVV